MKKINNSYFKAAPDKLIKSHMPFDYLWQLLEYPVTSGEFYEGKTQANASKPRFAFADSIAVFEKQTEMEYYESAVIRIERNGLRNGMQFDRLRQLKHAIEVTRQNKEVEEQNRKVEMINTASSKYNRAIYYINEFIDYRNKQFKPEKGDADIQAMLDAAAGKVKESNDLLAQIQQPPSNVATLMEDLKKGITDLSKVIGEQQEWLTKYFSKGKMGRKSMFTKITWMGIPMN